MTSTIKNSYNATVSKQAYENFYAERDFRHFRYSDRLLVQAIVARYELKGKLLMDVGSGTGWYSHLFNAQEVRAIGVELSMAGNLRAKKHFGTKHLCVTADGLELPVAQASVDAIFCSGFPPFNNEDLTSLHAVGERLFTVIKPGGIFLFRKTTDLSGRRNSRMNHRLEDYVSYFQQLRMGTVIGVYAESPIFWPFLREWSFSSMGTRLNKLFTKLTRFPLRAVVVVRRSM